MESRTNQEVVLAKWAAMIKSVSPVGGVSSQDQKEDDNYQGQLYGVILPPLLQSNVSLAECKIIDLLKKEGVVEKASAKQCHMIWQFVVAFGLRSGASLDEISTELQTLYQAYPNLAAHELEQENPQDKVQKLPERIKRNVAIQAHRLVKQYIYVPGDSAPRQGWRNVSHPEILRILSKNPALLNLVQLKYSGSESKDLGYRSFDKMAELNEGSVIFYNAKQQSLHSEIIGETIYARAVQKADAALCRDILQIMIDKGFKDHEIMNILRLPVYLELQEMPALTSHRYGHPLRDACFLSADLSFFQCVQKYVDKTLLTESSHQASLVQLAIYHNRIDILQYLQEQLHFDMKQLCSAVLQDDKVVGNMNAKTANFLVNQVGVDGQLLLEAFLGSSENRGIEGMNRMLARVNHFDHRVVDVILFFLVERQIDLGVLQKNYQASGDYIGTLIALFAGRSRVLKEQSSSPAQQAELGDIAYACGWMAEKFQKKSDVAEKYYQEAREYKNFKRDLMLIGTHLADLTQLIRPSFNVHFSFQGNQKQEREAKLFDAIGLCYKKAKENGAEAKEIFTQQDVALLLQAAEDIRSKQAMPVSQSGIARKLSTLFSSSEDTAQLQQRRQAICAELSGLYATSVASSPDTVKQEEKHHQSGSQPTGGS